jgi:beta-fructofuranosidase
MNRLLTVRGDDLFVEPAGDVESLRGDHVHFESINLPPNEDVVLDRVHGNAIEVTAEFEPGLAPMVEMNVLRSPGMEEFTRIAFFRNRGFRERILVTGRHLSLITVDSSRSSLAPDVQSRAPETAPVYLEPDEPLRLRVFVDRSVVEVFVNGKQCTAVRVYPERTDSVGVSFRSQGAPSTLRSLDAWQMRSIWPSP